MGRNKVLSRDEVVKSLKKQLTEYDITDIPTDAIRHLQMARIICECNYVFLDDVIETLANWLKWIPVKFPRVRYRSCRMHWMPVAELHHISGAK